MNIMNIDCNEDYVIYDEMILFAVDNEPTLKFNNAHKFGHQISTWINEHIHKWLDENGFIYVSNDSCLDEDGVVEVIEDYKDKNDNMFCISIYFSKYNYAYNIIIDSHILKIHKPQFASISSYLKTKWPLFHDKLVEQIAR